MFSRWALPGLLLIITGCNFPFQSTPSPDPAPIVEPPPVAEPTGPVHGPPVPPPPPPAPPKEAIPDGAVDYKLGDDLKLRVLRAQGVMPSVKRTVQLLQLREGQWQVTGAVNVKHLPGESVKFRTADLPGYPGAIVIEASRYQGVRHGAVAVADGQLVALDYHRLVVPEPEIRQGSFVYLNKYLNQLWAYHDGRLVATFPTANGRDPWGAQPTWDDFKTNYKTPEGLFTIRSKIVNPPYKGLSGLHPPAEGGAPNNPLGTRWIGFEALPGDGGGIWGFHGTYVPEQIGTWASEGCVRLNTADAEQLFDLVAIGTRVRIVGGR